MLTLPNPDPEVYLLAATKVRAGAKDTDAILSSVAELHPEVDKPDSSSPFQVNLFEWKWAHVHQYRDSFGNSCEYLVRRPDHPNIQAVKASKTPPRVKEARIELAAKSLELMHSLCKGTTYV